MNRKRMIIGLLGLGSIVLTGCESDTPRGRNSGTAGGGGSAWLIPVEEVFDGGPGKDGIPALLDLPRNNLDHSENDYLSDDDLVLGFKSGDVVIAYPHDILDWHEIINDRVGSESVAVTYCPLTGTGVGWNRLINNVETTFGVSGFLYNSNLIPYDRLTESNWSQIGLRCVNGELIGNTPEILTLIEMTWGAWKEIFPSSEIVSTNTGHNRTYGRYPYGSYKINTDVLFPISAKDDRMHEKERVLGIVIDGKSRVYRFGSFGPITGVIHDEFRGQKLVIAGKTDQYMVAYNREIEPGVILTFSPSSINGLLIDQEGTEWDLFGYAVSGPRKGSTLPAVTSFMGYWFSFPAFYLNTEIYE
jgi:hypothetical protein